MSRRLSLLFGAFLLVLIGCSTLAASQPIDFQSSRASKQLSIPAVTPDPSRPSIQWIQMIDDRDGWGITADRERLVLTRNGGASWKDVTPGVEAVKNTSSFFLDGDTAFVEGFDESAASNATGNLFITDNGGNSWKTYDLPFAGGSLYFQNRDTGWAVTLPWSAGTQTAALIYQTKDGGKNWSQLMLHDPRSNLPPDAPPGSVQLTNGAVVAARTPDNLWLGGGTSIPGESIPLWGSWDGGKTWLSEQLPSPLDGGTLPSQVTSSLPVFLDDHQAFLTASFVSTPAGGGDRQNAQVIYASQDGGKTWQRWPGLVQGVRPSDQPAFISEKTAFIHCAETVCATQDGGATWTALQSNLRFSPDLDLTLEQLDFVNDQVGWAVTPSALYRTLDGGMNWSIP